MQTAADSPGLPAAAEHPAGGAQTALCSPDELTSPRRRPHVSGGAALTDNESRGAAVGGGRGRGEGGSVGSGGWSGVVCSFSLVISGLWRFRCRCQSLYLR